MYVSLVKPPRLEPIELDQFLEKGWFRLGQTLFTTSFLTFQDNLFNALWLRINLQKFELSPSQSGLLKKASRFHVSINPFEFTEEKQALFFSYRESLEFEPARSLENILMEDERDIFNTFDVCIYDGTKLIACGIFDLGFLSVEGIVSFFDPEYKKYSLGKVLVLNKVLFCKQRGYHWFYPGYIVPGHKRFDYKLDVSRENSEYFDLTQDTWRNITTLDSTDQPLQRMFSALKNLELVLHTFGFEEFRLLKYRFYDIGLDKGYSTYNLLSYPYFIHCFSNSRLEEVVITYNTFSGNFQLLICHKVFQITMPAHEEYFSDYLIREARIVFQESNPLNFVFELQEILKRNAKAEK